MIVQLISLLSMAMLSWAQTAEFRYNHEKLYCENAKGKRGHNVGYFGECGDIEELDPSQLNFHKAYLKAALMRELNLQNRDLRESELTAASLQRADLRSADLTGAVLTRATLNDAQISKAKFNRVLAQGLQMSFLKNASEAQFENSFLPEISIWRCSCQTVSFNGSDLRMAVLTSNNFKKANFVGAQLESARLMNSDLSHANFKGANLNNTLYDECTLLPFSEAVAQKRGMRKVDRYGTPCQEIPQ